MLSVDAVGVLSVDVAVGLYRHPSEAALTGPSARALSGHGTHQPGKTRHMKDSRVQRSIMISGKAGHPRNSGVSRYSEFPCYPGTWDIRKFRSAQSSSTATFVAL